MSKLGRLLFGCHVDAVGVVVLTEVETSTTPVGILGETTERKEWL